MVHQQFTTNVLQECLQHAIPDYQSVALTSFPLDYQVKKMTTNTIAIHCEESKLHLFFLLEWKKYIFGDAAEF